MIDLEIHCRTCERSSIHEVGAILFDDEPVREDPDDPEAWARAVYVAMPLMCPHCEAVDDFGVTPASGRAVRAAVGGEVVREGRAALSDGTVIHTPSEGLRVLRERADASPRDAMRWRQLGNFAMRSARGDLALEAYGRGAEIEGELDCALALAVSTVAREAEGAVEAVARAAARLPRADPRRRPLQAAHLSELLRKLAARGEALVLHVRDGAREEAIDVANLRDWSALGERLASREVTAIRVERR